MHILHVTLGLPPYRTGGLTKYSVDLMLSQRELSHQVSMLYPGHYALGSVSLKANKEFQGIRVFEIVNPLPVPLLGGVRQPEYFMKCGDEEVYADFLRMLQPDVIHLHTLMGIHPELLRAAKRLRIKTVFTTHDYFGICPKVNLLNAEGAICTDYGNGGMCTRCNENGYGMLKIRVMQSRVYRHLKTSPFLEPIIRREKRKEMRPNREPERAAEPSQGALAAPDYVRLRKFYLEMLGMVDTFHFNSSTAESEYRRFVPAEGRVLPLTHRDITDRRAVKTFPGSGEPLRIAYLGPANKHKGFFMLQESLDGLKARGDWHLHVHGDAAGAPDDDPRFYTFHGKYRHGDLGRIFERTDLLVIPSLWKETFGFIGLEAMSFGVPVLAAETVGFKDFITDGVTGMVFRPRADNLADRMACILDERERLETMNRHIVQMEFPFTMERHVKEMMTVYKDMESKERKIV